jgi:hypothetical protein
MKHIQPTTILTARQFMDRIAGRYDTDAVLMAVHFHLKHQHAKAKRYQEKRGVRFDLTLDELLSKITVSRWRKMEAKMAKGEAEFLKFMAGGYGYVISWKNRKALRGKVMNIDTVAFINRDDSKLNSRFVAGDKHTEKAKKKQGDANRGKVASQETREKIRQSKLGKKQSEETVAARAEKLKGVPKSEEHKERMREAARKRWAKVRAAKEAAHGNV